MSLLICDDTDESEENQRFNDSCHFIQDRNLFYFLRTLPFLCDTKKHYALRCVFVDAGVALIDLETKRKKEEQKLKEAQNTAFAEHGELALITVDNPQKVANERISLRPPMLQVRMNCYLH